MHDELRFQRKAEASPRSLRGMVALLLIIGAAILTRPLWLPVPKEGVLVEVRGEVPEPGHYVLSQPTLSAALAAAGGDLGERPDRLLSEGAVVVVNAEEVTLGRPVDPLLIGLPVDVNLDEEVALEALPGIGHQLASAIVRERSEGGLFTSLDDLGRVPGLGEDTLMSLRPYLSAELPVHAPVDLNHASSVQLRRLPGIGPTLAQRIVRERQESGPFARLSDLRRVSGVGPATVARLEGLAHCGATP